MGWLSQTWEVTVRIDPLWTAILLIGVVLIILGPPLAINSLWLLRLRRARQSMAGFARLADALTDGVVLVRPDGRISLINQPAARLWPGTTVGAPLPSALARLHSDGPASTSSLVVAADGRQLAARAQPLATRRGHETLILLEDTTRQQAESAVATALVRQISHELKTPLSVIRGHASRFAALPERAVDPAELRRAWEVVDDEATRLTGLIDQAILMARFESPAPLFQARPLNLRAVCEEVVIDLAEKLARESSELDLEVDDGHYAIRGDRAALRQMLINLVDNAVKYAGHGAKVTISLTEEVDTERIRLAVRDNGPGIPEPDLPLVFEKGFRGSQSRGSRAGSGLGLALVRAIVEWHGGTVTAENSTCGGACVITSLPRTTEPTAATTPSDQLSDVADSEQTRPIEVTAETARVDG